MAKGALIGKWFHASLEITRRGTRETVEESRPPCQTRSSSDEAGRFPVLKNLVWRSGATDIHTNKYHRKKTDDSLIAQEQKKESEGQKILSACHVAPSKPFNSARRQKSIGQEKSLTTCTCTRDYYFVLTFVQSLHLLARFET